MNVETSRPLMFSVLLHAGILAVALLLLVPRNQAPVVTPRPFVLFPGPVQAQSVAPAAPDADAPGIVFPRVPVSVPHPATPAVQTVDTPVQHAPAAAAPVRRAPTVVPSTPAQASPRMTAQEFLKRHPHPVASAPAVSRPSSAAPHIDVDNVLSAVRSDTPAADGGASAAYFARLLRQLRAVHEPPAGLNAGLQALVEFSVQEGGTLTDVRILETSGSREFDESVLAAFGRLHGLGIPPNGASKGNRVTFRTNDGG